MTDHRDMMTKASSIRVCISWSSGQVMAALKDSVTTRKLQQALPIESTASRWGQEVYCEVPIRAALEPNAKQVVEPGTVCFWVEGRSLAIPFGPTPISRGQECRLVAPVNILGRIEGEWSLLDTIREGEWIRVDAVG